MECDLKIENETANLDGESNFAQNLNGDKLDKNSEGAADADYESAEEDEDVELEGGKKKDAKLEAARLTGDLLRNPQVMRAFEAKLGGMVGRRSGYIESLPKSVRRRIKALKKLQAAMFEVESKFFEEVHKLECKFAELSKPLTDKRDLIVNAHIEPTDSDCEWPSDEEDDDDDDNVMAKAKIVEIDETKSPSEVNKSETGDEETKGIPEFWLTILKNVEPLNSLIQENDEPILRHLTNIRIKHSSTESMDFTLEFVFKENEYFGNTVLTKHYAMNNKPDPDEPLQYQGPEIKSSKGCKIEWKPNKDVTIRKQRHKVKGTKKTVTKNVKVDSFFNFFSPPEVKEDVEDMDDEKRELLMTDFEIGQMLRERIIPRAVLYFTGEALDDDDDDDEDEDEDYDEDEDEDEDNDPDYVPSANEASGPPECKQQ